MVSVYTIEFQILSDQIRMICLRCWIYIGFRDILLVEKKEQNEKNHHPQS